MAQRRKEYKIQRSEISWNSFKAIRNLYFFTIRKAKQESWSTFLSEAKGTEIFKAYRYTKPRTIERLPPLQLGDKRAIDFKDKCGILKEAMFPIPPSLEGIEEPQTQDPLEWPEITSKEIEQAISTSSSKSAPGPDGISYLILKKALEATLDLIYKSYKLLINNGYHPLC